MPDFESSKYENYRNIIRDNENNKSVQLRIRLRKDTGSAVNRSGTNAIAEKPKIKIKHLDVKYILAFARYGLPLLAIGFSTFYFFYGISYVEKSIENFLFDKEPNKSYYEED